MQKQRLEKRDKEKSYFKEVLQETICSLIGDKIIWFDEGMAFKIERDEEKLKREKNLYINVINPLIKKGVPNYPMLYLIINCPPTILVIEKSTMNFLEFLQENCNTITKEELYDDIFQIFTAHYFLLKNGYIQSDLKPDNIFVDINIKYDGCYNYSMVYDKNVYIPLYGYLLKLADFGFTKEIKINHDLTYDYKRFLILLRRELGILKCDDLFDIIDIFESKLDNLGIIYERIRVNEIKNYLESLMIEQYEKVEKCEIVISK